jgi:hypothetical protein
LPSGRRINYHAKDLLLLFQPPLHFFLLIINRSAHALLRRRKFLFSLHHADEMTHLIEAERKYLRLCTHALIYKLN